MVSDYKYNTAKHTCLKVEDLHKGTPYAITINPEIQFTGIDKKSKVRSYSFPHATMKKYMETWLLLCKASTYELYFELSPLGRQHYHGIIEVHDIERFYTVDIHILQLIGTFMIKPIKDAEVDKDIVGVCWYKYCTKQDGIWKDRFNINTKIIKLPTNP